MYATHLVTASKKGISADQLHRMLGFGSYRTTWFMAMRLREAMAERGLLQPLGGDGKVVEADETYYGKRAVAPTTRTDGMPFLAGGKSANKRPVIGLVERGGKARMFHVAAPTRRRSRPW